MHFSSKYRISHPRPALSVVRVRGAAAKHDWLFIPGNGHKTIKIMRDRKKGHNRPMLAGMCEADNIKPPEPGDKLRKRMILMSQLSSAQDKSFYQQLLSNVIFHAMAKNFLAYDSYNCVNWSTFTEVRSFPVLRGNPATDFVGNRVNFTGDGKKRKYGIVKCPLECRPSHGLDWIYCWISILKQSIHISYMHVYT